MPDLRSRRPEDSRLTMTENLLDPLFLFFPVGFLAGILKSDLKLPDAVHQLLST